MTFATSNEVKANLRITDNARNSDIDGVIAAATASVKSYCKRDFAAAAIETQNYRCPEDPTAPLLVEDISSRASISVSGNGLTWAYGAEIDANIAPKPDGVSRVLYLTSRLSWASVANENGWIAVSASFGWAEVPSPIRQATRMLAARLYKRLDSGEAILGFGGDFEDASYIRAVDPDISKLLLPYSGRRFSVA